MKRSLASAVLLLLTPPSQAAPSLCLQGETVFFSCPVQGGKIVSLCGAVQDIAGRESGDDWLQYRFGRPGAVELRYPEKKRDSLDAFKAEHVLTHTQDFEIDLQSVSFVSGGIGYQVESGIPATRRMIEGVSIGNPTKFDLPSAAKPRASYPDTFIACAGKAETRHFYELIHYLRD